MDPSALRPLIVTLEPSGTVPPDIDGVVSEVLLSVFDAPESDAGNRSGAAGADGAVPSMFRLRPPVGPAVLPAGSVAAVEMSHAPSLSGPTSQLFTVGDFTYVQVFVVWPALLADTVTVSPSATLSPAVIAGVVSFVRLSVDDEPVSESATRSGVPALADVSTARFIGADAADSLPAPSVCLADTAHEPSDSVPRSQEVAGRTYEHDTGAEPSFDAVIVIRSPSTAPAGVADMVGVLSFVTLSVFDEPVSDAAARSTALGAEGGVRSMVTVLPSAFAPGPVPPLAGAMELAASRGVTVPSPHDEAVTVNDDVDTEVIEKTQPADVPAFEMSAAVNDAGSIAAENVSVQSMGFVDRVGVAAVVANDVTLKALY